MYSPSMVSLAWSPGMPGTYIIYKGIQETTSHGEFYYCTLGKFKINLPNLATP